MAAWHPTFTPKIRIMETALNMSARSLQFYVIAKKWFSDLQFYKIETAFFHSLIEDHFIHLTGAKYMPGLRQVNNDLLKLDRDIDETEGLLGGQIKHVELMAEDIIPEDTEAATITQVQLEYRITSLLHDYRQLKAELFKLVERVMRETWAGEQS